ncbi:MAG: hypothetical protein WC341_08045 [Bacteroidales bacterium]|jgi:hypothetical protein
MKKLILLAIIALTFASCQILKNGVAEPQSLQERTLPKPHYDSVVYTTEWNYPYQVLNSWQQDSYSEFVRAKTDTAKKEFPKTLRNYTIPIPTKN